MRQLLALAVRLYPAPFRARWGAEATEEATAVGLAALPDLLRGAASMWIHPTVWPARSAAHRRGRAVGLAVAVSAAAWYVLHAATELDGALNRWWVGSPAVPIISTVLLAVGALLVVPRPRLGWPAFRVLVARAVRYLTVPTLVAAGVGVGANTIPDVEGSPWRPVLFAAWWLALAAGAAGGWRTVAGLDVGLAVPPAGRVLRVGLVLLAAAVALPGASLVVFAATEHDLAAAFAGGGLLAAAAVLLPTLGDLAQVRVD